MEATSVPGPSTVASWSEPSYLSPTAILQNVENIDTLEITFENVENIEDIEAILHNIEMDNDHHQSPSQKRKAGPKSQNEAKATKKRRQIKEDTQRIVVQREIEDVVALERENMDLENEEMTLKQRLEHMQNTYLGFIEKGQIVFIENPTSVKSLALSPVSSNIGEALPTTTPWSIDATTPWPRDATTPWPKEAGSSDQGSSLPREPVEPRETARSGLPMTHNTNEPSSPHWPIPCNPQGKAFCLFCNM